MSLEKLKGRSCPLWWGRGMVTRCDCGGPTQVVLSGGWPGRALGRMGTLVVRITGSSVLVEDVVDGGGGGAVRCRSAVVR